MDLFQSLSAVRANTRAADRGELPLETTVVEDGKLSDDLAGPEGYVRLIEARTRLETYGRLCTKCRSQIDTVRRIAAAGTSVERASVVADLADRLARWASGQPAVAQRDDLSARVRAAIPAAPMPTDVPQELRTVVMAAVNQIESRFELVAEVAAAGRLLHQRLIATRTIDQQTGESLALARNTLVARWKCINPGSELRILARGPGQHPLVAELCINLADVADRTEPPLAWPYPLADEGEYLAKLAQETAAADTETKRFGLCRQLVQDLLLWRMPMRGGDTRQTERLFEFKRKAAHKWASLARDAAKLTDDSLWAAAERLLEELWKKYGVAVHRKQDRLGRPGAVKDLLVYKEDRALLDAIESSKGIITSSRGTHESRAEAARDAVLRGMKAFYIGFEKHALAYARGQYASGWILDLKSMPVTSDGTSWPYADQLFRWFEACCQDVLPTLLTLVHSSLDIQEVEVIERQIARNRPKLKDVPSRGQAVVWITVDSIIRKAEGGDSEALRLAMLLGGNAASFQRVSQQRGSFDASRVAHALVAMTHGMKLYEVSGITERHPPEAVLAKPRSSRPAGPAAESAGSRPQNPSRQLGHRRRVAPEHRDRHR
ncbi:MAG: hypothetical protein HY905_04690 [Deltaproteobacteria bacterium]|nr:hypothetical protein [Deltaproteobacteria bacterium]